HARSMNLPIIVAVNKMDRVDPARLDIVRKQLSDQNLLPEEWGGQTIVVPISAKTGDGVDKLLEMIVLQSEIMELGADKGAQAQGYVLESKLEKGRGVVATVICQTGTVHIGDYFICGKTYGKVTSLVNCHGARVEKTGPSIPVQVAGFDGIPDVGDTFSAVSEQEFKKIKQAGGSKIQSVPRAMLDQDSIPLVLKADTHSSLEALIGSLEKISKKEEKGFQIIHSAVGDINESDILLGSNTGGMIVGFHVKTDPNAVSLAQKEGVQVRHFNIIYKLLEDLQVFLKGKEEVKMVRVKTGEGLVLKVFDIKKIGVIAGCRVQDGKFVRDGNVVVWRGKYKVGQGKITSLQRDKKTVKEVLTGFEFACIVDEFTEWQVDDRVECFIDKPAK
ncbi:MAG: translation initiation factor IF-2, partial [Candidatus Babeliales bacterium]